MKAINHAISGYFSQPSLAAIKEKISGIVQKVVNFVKAHGFFMGIAAFSGGAIAFRVSGGSLPITALGAFICSAVFTFWDWRNQSAVNQLLDRTNPNRNYQTARPLALSTFINKPSMEKGMEAVIQDLKNTQIKVKERSISLYDSLLEIFKDDKDFFSLDMEKGLINLVCKMRCLGHGQANALLSHIYQTPQASSAELLQILKDHPQEVCASQLLACVASLLLQKMRNEKVAEVMNWIFDRLSKIPEDQPQFEIVGGSLPVETASLPEGTFDCYKEIACKTYITPSTASFFLSDTMHIAHKTAEDYQKLFADATKDFPEGAIISGKLELIHVSNFTNKSSEEAIWFQCSAGKYRFYDGSMYDQGLFEFPNMRAFLEGLKKQLDYQKNRSNAAVRISINGFNQTA